MLPIPTVGVCPLSTPLPPHTSLSVRRAAVIMDKTENKNTAPSPEDVTIVASPVPETMLEPSTPGPLLSASDQRLLELGYQPEFKRDMSLFGVLGMSFCAIGILTGMSSAIQTGLLSGGPLGLFWGWNVRDFRL